MLRLFQMAIVVMFGYLLWRTFRIMSRSSKRDNRSIYDPPEREPEKKQFRDVKDAEFTDLKSSEKEKKPE